MIFGEKIELIDLNGECATDFPVYPLYVTGAQS